jgi:hypothetical protein
LIDAAADKPLWAHSYEQHVGDVLSLQGQIARKIAQRIEVELTPEETRRLAEARPVDPEAHEAAYKALRIDDTLAQGHVVLAGALLCYDLNRASAEPCICAPSTSTPTTSLRDGATGTAWPRKGASRKALRRRSAPSPSTRVRPSTTPPSVQCCTWPASTRRRFASCKVRSSTLSHWETAQVPSGSWPIHMPSPIVPNPR